MLWDSHDRVDIADLNVWWQRKHNGSERLLKEFMGYRTNLNLLMVVGVFHNCLNPVTQSWDDLGSLRNHEFLGNQHESSVGQHGRLTDS